MASDLKCIDTLMEHLDTIGRRETYRCAPSLQYWRFDVPSGLRNHVLLLRLDWRARGAPNQPIQEVHVSIKYTPDRASWFEDEDALIDMSWSFWSGGSQTRHRLPAQDIKSQSLSEVVLLCRVLESIVLAHLEARNGTI